MLLVIPIIAGLGYLSGYHEFYIIKKLKIFDKLRKKQEERRKQQQPQKRENNIFIASIWSTPPEYVSTRKKGRGVL